MKRRGFLSGILGAGAVAKADIDALAKEAQAPVIAGRIFEGPTYSVPEYSVTLQPPIEAYEEPLFVTSSWRELFLEDRTGQWAWRPNYSSVRSLADRKARYRDRYARRGASLPRVLYRSRRIPTNILEYHRTQQGLQAQFQEVRDLLNLLGGK